MPKRSQLRRSQWDIAVLLPRIFQLLRREHAQVEADASARRARLDDVVDKAAHGRRERIAEQFSVLPLVRGQVGSAAVQNGDGALQSSASE